VQWFGPKEPGFELGVRTWQGWVAIATFLIFMIGPNFVDFHALGLPHWVEPAIRISAILIFVSLFLLTYRRD
jgi:hypothetical protein